MYVFLANRMGLGIIIGVVVGCTLVIILVVVVVAVVIMKKKSGAKVEHSPRASQAGKTDWISMYGSPDIFKPTIAY